MATTHTTITDPGTGDSAVIYAQTSLPTQLSDKDIERTLADASKSLEMEKGKLSSHGKTLVEDTQALLDTTRKNELFQKLFAFAKKSGVSGAEGVPSEDLKEAGRTLMERVTGMASSLQTDAEDLAGYIRGEIYNYLTSSEYRDILSDFYNIIKEFAAEIEEEMEEEEPDYGEWRQPKRTGRAWNRPLELPAEFSTKLAGQVKQQQEKEGLLQQQRDRPTKVGGQQGQQERLSTQQRSDRLKKKQQDAEDKALDDLQERCNNFLSKLAEKDEYQSLVKNFFKFSDQVNDILIDVAEDAKRTPEARQARELIDSSYEILSDFAGKKKVETYRKDLNGLLNKIKNDNELKRWREQCRDYVLDFLKNPDVSDKNIEQFKGMIRQGRQLLRKYRSDIDVVYDDQVKIAQAIKDDPALQDFNNKLTTLGSHLALNEKGEIDPSKVQESVVQIANLVGGLFHDYLAKLALTRVDIVTQNYDLSMSDIKVRGTGFAPDKIEIKTLGNTTLHFVQGRTNQSSLLVSFAVGNINPSFEDFNYTFRKKSFPEYTDSGRASISCTTDDGLSIQASILIKSIGTRPPRASLKSLWVRLGMVSLNTYQESHSVLTPMLAPFYAETVRQRIESLVYNQIRMRFDDVVVQLNDFFATNPIQRVTQQLGASIQSNLPSLEEKTLKKPVEPTINKP